jgi:hypothetical protein
MMNFSLATDLISRPQVPTSSKIKKPELCPKEREKLKYKQDLARDVIAALCRSSDNPLMMAQAARIEKCNADNNLFVGEDFHTADGELFEGRGSLWACNSRLCPNCVGKLSKQNRRIIRYVMENQKLLVGEDWYFTTFTMPNLNLKDLELPMIAQIMQTAWKRFSTLETRNNKKKSWFQKTIRGGFKNAEFTYTENDNYHYHLHTLLVAKNAIQGNKFLKIREHWTKALQFAFEKFGIAWECKTGNKNFIPALMSFMWAKPKMSLFLNAQNTTKFFGLADVKVQKVDWMNREKTINELCKYVTKSDSWSKIPTEQLAQIVAVPRFWRMFESFGVCRKTARQMKENTVKTSANADIESVNQGENFNDGAYIYTKDLINRQANADETRARRVSWRIRAKEIPLWQYRMELANEISEVQRFRRYQLQRKFSFATFQTLSGEIF